MSKIEIKPISINKCWQGKRFKTPVYKSWRQEAVLLLRSVPKIESKNIAMKVKFYIKHYGLTDTSNMIKPLEDALVEAGVIKDDRYFKQILMEKEKSEDERIEFEIIDLDNEMKIDFGNTK